MLSSCFRASLTVGRYYGLRQILAEVWLLEHWASIFGMWFHAHAVCH